MSSFSIDNDAIRQLADLLNETNLTEIEVADGERRIRVARQNPPLAALAPAAAPPAAAVAAAPTPAAAPAAEDWSAHPGALKSPMVGVVYTAPEPGAGAFVAVGDQVSEGQTVLLIEAMKTFNPIRAPKSGKVTHILVSDGVPVEYGEPLLIIE